MIYSIHDKKIIAPLFGEWEEVCLWSCLQDCMGVAFADDVKTPNSAQTVIGAFSFLGGTPNDDLIKNIPENYSSDSIIFVPQNEDWEIAIENIYKDRAVRKIRYATKKQKDVFDKAKLQSIVDNLPDEYQIVPIDQEIYNWSKSSPWAKDWCANFADFESYQKQALGFAIIHADEIVAGVSTYAFFKEGIEIQIDTRENYRRKGLALVCGAKIILECLDRNLYPGWDAQNKGSLAVAKKLGYEFDREYPVYEVKK